MAEGTDSLFVNWRTGRPQLVDTTGIADNTITTPKIANDAVTYGKLQNISAQFRALGRNSSGAGDVEEVTLSQLLDWIGSAAQGDILYRGASTWARLAAGTSGQFLQTLGSGANPQWAGPTVTIASGSLTGAAVNITDIPQYFGRLLLRITGMSFDTAARALLVQVSTNNGVSFDTSAGNYVIFSFTTLLGIASLSSAANHAAAADTENSMLAIEGYQSGGYIMGYGVQRIVGVGSTVSYSMYDGSTSAINALQLLLNGSGNFDAGTYALIGVY